VIYGEAGHFKTTTASRSGDLPESSGDRVRRAPARAGRVRGGAAGGERVLAQLFWIPFLIYALAALRAEFVDRLRRPASAGTRGFMPSAPTRRSSSRPRSVAQHPDRVVLAGLVAAGRARVRDSQPDQRFYLAVATLAAQFFLNLAVQQGAVVREYASLAPSPRRRARSSA